MRLVLRRLLYSGSDMAVSAPRQPQAMEAAYRSPCAIFGTVMLLLAFGKYGGFYYLVVDLPVFRDFRIPARYIHFVHFALAILVAVAYSDLVALCRRQTVCCLAITLAADYSDDIERES